MRSGIMMGTASMIDGMVERMEAELGASATVIATGGIAKFIVPLCKTPLVYDKDLIVKGLAALYRENRR
jgi:type III pantothenate kinase